MRISTRKLLDRSFSSVGVISIALMGLILLVILVPIFRKGIGALVFEATVEHRRLILDNFDHGDDLELAAEIKSAREARQPVYEMVQAFESRQQAKIDSLRPDLETLAERDDSMGRLVARRLKRLGPDEDFLEQVETIQQLVPRLREYGDGDDAPKEIAAISSGITRITSQTLAFAELKEVLYDLLGPAPGEPMPQLTRKQYGQTRWEKARETIDHLFFIERWDYSGPGMGTLVREPRVEQFRETEIEPLFAYVEGHAEAMLQPRWTLYWGFLTDKPLDSHIFGGIYPELIGTIYLTLGAILFAVPIGIIAAIYFTEYAKAGRLISFLRACVSTLAGVPSIVFGMFGLAFFLNVWQLPKGVLAGSLTLALLILPVIIRASEEAIRSVPHTYREAALSLGAGRWRTIVTVILPAALPGILTGIVISMGRAAGETAPIIFTAAASVAAPLSLNPLQAWDQPTAALSWNIYNLCTEHEAADEIRHVQFGMVAVLITVVLALNLFAIILRARIAKKLKG